jgi:NADPH2:quinone reductase
MSIDDRLKKVRGIVVERLGDWREARLGTLPLSPPGPGQVLIECEAAALNAHDLLLADGTYQVKPPTPYFAGGDLVGRIAALGPSVTGFRVGQRVAASVFRGAFAELVLASADRTYPVPEDIDTAKAASVATAFATVAVALAIKGELKAGERLLVTGASGGVGIAALQYARMIGAETAALVSSAEKARVARQAGASHVLRLDQMKDPKEDMRPALVRAGLDHVDAVLDVIGGAVFDGALRCLAPGGRMLVVGFASGQIPEIKANYLLLKDIRVIGSALESGFRRHGPELYRIMVGIFEAVARGEIDPFVSAAFPFEDFHQAAQRIADRTATGKIVLLP